MKNASSSIVLVTGGTGSFGKTMVRRLLNEGYKEIRILSRDEAKQEEMRIAYSRPELKFYIGDVRDRAAVDKAMKGVDLVFHAAALKQVPSCEFFPMEAVKTNIIGSHNVIDSAVDAGVKSLVCLSTDKAVMPVNAMGMSKAMMEKVAQASSRQLGDNDTVISCVRDNGVFPTVQHTQVALQMPAQQAGSTGNHRFHKNSFFLIQTISLLEISVYGESGINRLTHPEPQARSEAGL